MNPSKASMLPSISIITPSYNQAQFIEETINSVLSQNYPQLEYWVIDGGSTDGTLDILKKYKKYINFESQRDRGQTHAINKGIRKTKGDIVAYLNSDDVYLPGTLQSVGKLFQNNPKVDWVTGDYFIINERNERIQSYVVNYKKYLRSLNAKNVLAVANYIIQPSTFWRRSVIKKIGYFDESLHYCMDFDYWMKLYGHSTPLLSPKPLSLFRIHQTSKGNASFQKQFREEHEIVKSSITNPVILLLHKLHASGIVLAYHLIK